MVFRSWEVLEIEGERNAKQRRGFMLRPAKLFHSLHQLRHYVQTKVTELVVAQHPPPFLLPNPTASSTNTLTPWTHQTKPITNGLQRQFPMINKTCSPLISCGGPLSSWRPSVVPTASIWHRGISLGINGGYHGLGAFRSYSSSTATPFFQAYHSATSSTHSTVLSHLSSRIFAPLANTMPVTKTTTTTYKQDSSPTICRPVQQQTDKSQPTQPMGSLNKYNTLRLPKEQPTTPLSMEVTPVAEKPTTTTVIQNAMRPALLCIQDDLTTDTMHSVTVPTTQTSFYITLDLVPTTLDTILSHSNSAFDSSGTESSSPCTPWTKDVWPMLVKWKERQQDYYDQLLVWLQPCLDKGYRIQLVKGESSSSSSSSSSMRLYFPKQVKKRAQALAWLDELKHVGGDKNEFLALVELEEVTITVDEPLAPLGPDYFQGIHLFLSHIDDLVDHGPAFAASI